jgi:hypothetical protein
MLVFIIGCSVTLPVRKDRHAAFENVKFFTNFSCEQHANPFIIRRDADSKLKRVSF